VWWNGVNTSGNYHAETWGSYAWITPAGAKDCDPGGFVVFSSRWFNSSGMAPNGYSYGQLAAFWQQMGGKTLPVWPSAPTQGDRLFAGQGLRMGGSIHSDDHRFSLILQFDGNLVLYGPQNQPLWASGTAGKTTMFDAIMQTDGNFVVYNGQDQPQWASGTNGKLGAWLIVQNDGNLVIYDPNNHPLWASNTVVPAQPAAWSQPAKLLAGQGLMPGGAIRSTDGRFTLTLQGNGNLVLSGPAGEIMWISNTAGHSNVWDLVMQGDGNLVIYDAHGHPFWASNTSGKPGAWLIVQTDGNAVIYGANGQPLWATNTVVPAQPGTPNDPTKMLPGQGLLVGHSVHSADGRFTFVLQADGNLVLYGPQNQPLWASGTAGKADVWQAIMQGDGNLVIYDAQNHPLWASNTAGKPGSWFVVQNDGNAVIYHGNQAVWASNTVVPGEPTITSQPGRLLPGQGLRAGGSLTSPNGLLRFSMQGDGNLVLYDWYNQPLWASNTSGHSNIWDVVMQTDGNLVVYDAHNHPLWASNTSGKPGATLSVQNDGNVVIYDTGNHPLWATNTEIGKEILRS
jgi:hypothetical protein